MNWWQRTFGRKAVLFDPPTEVSAVLAGYPNWPVFDSYGAMYRKQPAVRTVVDFMARNVAQLNPKIYQRLDDNDRREWFEHPLAVLLRRPNPTSTRYSHLRDTVSDIAIYDRAYWRMQRQKGLVKALVRIPPSRLLIEVNPQTLKTTYRFDGEIITRNEMVVFHGYHPDGGEQGVSPLETLRRILSEDWASSTHREWYWRNASRQGGVIERPLDAPDWSQDAQSRFLDQWQSMTTGGVNSGKTPMLQDGMKWVSAGFSPKDSEYIESRKLTTVEVARVYAPALVGLLDTQADVESFHRQLYQDVLAPVLRMLQDEIDAQLLALDEFDLGSAYCEFNLADKLKGSFEEQGRTLVTSVGVPYMTVNEGRARQNLTRLDDPAFDVPIQPLNVLYGGQPSVVVPTSDPGMPQGVGGGGSRSIPGGGIATPREIAEMIQKIYLGVGVVLSVEEARAILNRAGADLTGLPELAGKMARFFEEQEQSVCSRLGPWKEGGSELTVLSVWDEKRWNRDHPAGAETAVVVNAKTRDRVTKAFIAGGIPAVHAIFETLKADADQFVPRVLHPAV